jgi:hypothetical protein
MIFFIRDDPSWARFRLGDGTDLLSRSPAASSCCCTYFGLEGRAARRAFKRCEVGVSTIAASTMTDEIQSLT